MSNAAPRNPLGVHALVWVGGWSEPEARTAIASTRRAGYDLIEIPLLDPDSVDVEMTRRLLAEHDLAMTASLGLSPATDVSSEDPDVVAAGERLLAGGASPLAPDQVSRLIGRRDEVDRRRTLLATPAGRTDSWSGRPSPATPLALDATTPGGNDPP